MSPIRALGSALSLLTGAWAAFLARFGFIPTPEAVNAASPRYSGIPSAELQGILLVVGAILIVDAMVSLVGVRAGFMLGAALSAVVLALVVLSWGGVGTNEAWAAVLLSAITIPVDAVSSRPARGLSEKDSPLNLPVFG